MPAYYPKVAVRITVSYQLSRTREQVDEVTFFAHPRSAKISRNEFSKADECELEFDSARFPVLPRSIRQMLFQVYLGDTGSLDGELDIESRDVDLAFLGYGDDPELALSDTDGTFKVKLRDFTALYLDAKRPPQTIVPTFGDNLKDALRRILDNVAGGDRIRLELWEDGAESLQWPDLSAAAPPGLQKAKIAYDPNDTLWKLIERCCEPFGLIPRIDLDTLVVATSRALRPAVRPLFVYGGNLLDYREKRQTIRIREGIALQGYDLSTQSYIVALWPPAGDQSVQKKIKATKAATGKKGQKPKALPTVGATGTPISSSEKRHFWPYGAVANEQALLDAARSIYESRSRQEFEGSFTAARMQVIQDSGTARYDVRKITSGDSVVVDVLPQERQMLGGFTSQEERSAYLTRQGYPSDLAVALARIYESGVQDPIAVFVRSATLSISEGEGFRLGVQFQALLTPGP